MVAEVADGKTIRDKCPNQIVFSVFFVSHTIHGTGIFTYTN